MAATCAVVKTVVCLVPKALNCADVNTGTCTLWAEDERLRRAPGIDFLPGANGVKRYHDRVMVSSTGRALVLSVAIAADETAGEIRVVAEHTRVDDLAFDCDGRAYVTTHIGHSLDRLDQDGTRVTLAGVDQGMAGSTACAFGRRSDDRTALYVTTTGGIVMPPNGNLQPAKLVRLEIGVAGY